MWAKIVNIQYRPQRLDDIPGRLIDRGAFSIIRQLHGGHRNQAFLVRAPNGAVYVAKTTCRSEKALAWAARLQGQAMRFGIEVPQYIQGPNGRYANGGLTLEPMFFGREAQENELALIRPALTKLKAVTSNWKQRPGFVSVAGLLSKVSGGDVDLSLMPDNVVKACRAAWEPLKGHRRSVIHGDINITNVLINPYGRPVLLDWDEARCDSPLFDLAPFRPNHPSLQHIRLAWEVASGWQREPDAARVLAKRLLATYHAEKLADCA